MVNKNQDEEISFLCFAGEASCEKLDSDLAYYIYVLFFYTHMYTHTRACAPHGVCQFMHQS